MTKNSKRQRDGPKRRVRNSVLVRSEMKRAALLKKQEAKWQELEVAQEAAQYGEEYLQALMEAVEALLTQSDIAENRYDKQQKAYGNTERRNSLHL